VGRRPVYAGFDLDQASLRTTRVDRHRDRLRGTCIGLWHFHVPGDKNSAARFTQRSKRANLSRYFFFGTFPARNVKD
jgi:hypothetical protein